MRDETQVRGKSRYLRLLDEADRLKAKVRLVAERNEAGGLLNRRGQAKIIGKNPQLFPACLVIFNNMKP